MAWLGVHMPLNWGTCYTWASIAGTRKCYSQAKGTRYQSVFNKADYSREKRCRKKLTTATKTANMVLGSCRMDISSQRIKARQSSICLPPIPDRVNSLSKLIN
jgi:hypothetical protein